MASAPGVGALAIGERLNKNGVFPMRKFAVLLLIAWMLPSSPAQGCSLCGTLSRNNSLSYEFGQATVVIYGYLANPKLTGKSGSGTTEFHVDQIIKDDPAFPRQKVLLLARYLPILDPKTPPKYVMFFRAPKQSLEPYWGKEITSPAVLHFVADLQRRRSDPVQMLLIAAKHFDDADANVADEAFMVFAKANDNQIAQMAKKLDPAKLRKLVKNSDLEPERLSMFAYLLGACGNNDDAELLRSLLKNQTARGYKSFEGVLAGYMTMRPKEGWAFAQETLKNDKQSFLLRYATLRTLRFFYNANPEATGAQVMKALSQAIGQRDIADIAIQDLRMWKRWEHTKLIVSCWDKKSHQSPIIRQSMVRYALACREPEARALLERARREDPELVRDMEDELK
jgi:hypothetical protein